MEAEKTIYKACPSQIVNLKNFAVALLMMAAIVVGAYFANIGMLYGLLIAPLLFAWWKYLVIKSTRLTVTDERIILSEGVLNKRTNETELYRVRDTTIEEPLFYRIFGLGNIIVFTTDEAEATVRLKAYAKPHWVKDQIRNYAEVCRNRKRWGNDSIMIHEHNNNFDPGQL